MSTATPATTRTELERWLRERIAERVECEPDAVDVDAAFATFGLESKDAIALSGELEERVGRPLEPTLAYEHPTIRALAAFLADDAAPPTGGLAPALAPARAPASRRRTREPIAVAGLACRFPGGASTPQKLWELLADGRDAGVPVPPDRWDADAFYDKDPAAPGKAYTRTGAFVEDLAEFDNELFALSPGEALRMDPQQRMLLELSWAALEDAGLAADRLRGSRTGVFVGLMDCIQYAQLQIERVGRELADDPFFGTGASASVAAGRIAYLLDLRGPAIALDTACSSSLVAAHLAVTSLRRGECDLALVGGASAIASPHGMVQACAMRMLARDGRCKTFDAAADGFLLGEGCGVVVLERLSDAVARGHRVLGVIEGTAVNQDGRTNGLSAPSREAQTAVIRAALEDAGVEPADIDCVEAHGSGTALGDAIEVGALRDAFGSRPDDSPALRIGSVKTNLGHLQAAAGVAGLAKAILMLQRGEVARTINLDEPNPSLGLDGTPLAAATEHAPWPRSRGPRRMSVSSFGWSGTNAHAVVRAAAEPQLRPSPEGWTVLPLSAATPGALPEVARALGERLAAADAPPLADAAYTTAVGRAALRVRRALVCRDAEEAQRALAGVDADAGVRATAVAGVPFVFDGPLSADALRELHETEPAFRRAFDAAAAAAGADLLAAGAPSAAARLAADHALAALWEHWNVRPSAVVAAGDGAELSAARVAGALSLEEALRIAVEPDAAAAVEPREPRVPVVATGDGLELRATASSREARLREAAALWERGVPVEWEAVFEGRAGRRVALPTYPFQHRRYWPEPDGRPVEPAAPGKRPDVADWCSAPVWRQALPAAAGELGPGPWLVLGDGEAGARVAAALRGAGAVVTLVAPGAELVVRPGGDCEIDPRTAGHYHDLLGRLRAADTAPVQVLHAWCVRSGGAGTAGGVRADLAAGFDSVLLLARALTRASADAPVDLAVATSGGADVLGDDPVEPARAAISALARCLEAEQPNLRLRAVDVEAGDAARQLVAELRLPRSTAPAAWRGDRRWTVAYEPVRVETPAEPVWRRRGVYVVTGGRGELGGVVARHLASAVQARLVLVGRTPVADDDPAVAAIAAAGGEAIAVAADVADPGGAARVVAQAKERFGAIHGVIHAAGVPGGGLFQRKDLADAEAVLRPKVLGTVALADALAGERLDVFALFSSSAAVLGGVGESDYAAANAFMDAWAASAGRDVARHVASIAWGPWKRDAWQEKLLAGAPALAGRVRTYRDRLGIADDEGIEVLTRVLASPLRHALVLPQDIETTVATIAALAGGDLLDTKPRQVFPRPELACPYRPPRSDLERRLAGIWAEQLGVDRVGLDDPFFELGGNSLVGLSILARIERDLDVEVTPGSLFERPTVGALAALLSGEDDPAEELAELAARGDRRRQLAAAARRRTTGVRER
ncbi:MAG TPA: SDR family NAD(P)-dependent oxidoreductase [Solirubrobacteraceae bacterium]|nr:SDR family NAD(P)-dependent oxidoreductase [Solirubrobacteraceae bacterium]